MGSHILCPKCDDRPAFRIYSQVPKPKKGGGTLATSVTLSYVFCGTAGINPDGKGVLRALKGQHGLVAVDAAVMRKAHTPSKTTAKSRAQARRPTKATPKPRPKPRAARKAPPPTKATPKPRPKPRAARKAPPHAPRRRNPATAPHGAAASVPATPLAAIPAAMGTPPA